ncbi:hypothetical protein GUITHDRAFT_119226 [Guillardia theta CCMP2712]|uniref:Uncharacterized protein n=1 Tax=Guillardia theta (strain CCMP2712) TaxID=905079 RepID=L1IEQ8_GUITC|nr:hypothetical protein GUITHDRAFT_119226 [Guillardia theta CCMP2712]EKX34577.1 hypothetical protein GUITHDRAFT_119226 [Guillardia theta CCMP2712]|eukprot:XP_005821557.1 hypothetical protein GUITHDRAFT_119226 [Guillardia theta CCMP2712]
MDSVMTWGWQEYGTSELTRTQRNASVSRQILYSSVIVAAALAVCTVLIATADLRGSRTALYQPYRPMMIKRGQILYGLGSGPEQDGENAAAVAFGTFDGLQDSEGNDIIPAALGEDYYVPQFEEIAESAAVEENIAEVTGAISEAQQEHKLLKTFAEGADAPLA